MIFISIDREIAFAIEGDVVVDDHLGMGHSYGGFSPPGKVSLNSEPLCLRVQLTGYTRRLAGGLYGIAG
jgi:hypothetical protein